MVHPINSVCAWRREYTDAKDYSLKICSIFEWVCKLATVFIVQIIQIVSSWFINWFKGIFFWSVYQGKLVFKTPKSRIAPRFVI